MKKTVTTPPNKYYLDWVDALKAFAILGILLNHLIEEFGPGPWFTNPTNDWPDFATRMQNILPAVDNWIAKIVFFLGWLGDSGPGVFILLSGFGLSLGLLKKNVKSLNIKEFYTKRLLRIFPLYIAIHLLVLLGSNFVPGYEFSVGSIDSFFSLLGLRFTDELFFHINPSWWFIWLILQMYIVFPLLFKLMGRVGISWFLVITFGFTFLSRGMGLLGVDYSDNLYYWMTGLFLRNAVWRNLHLEWSLPICLSIHEKGSSNFCKVEG